MYKYRQLEIIYEKLYYIIILQRRHNINNSMFKVTVVHYTQMDISIMTSAHCNDLPDLMPELIIIYICSNCVIINYSVISLPMVVSFPSYLIFVVMHLPGFQHPARLAYCSLYLHILHACLLKFSL